MTLEEVFEATKDYCVAIYHGGSRVDPVIEHPQDTDYILFTDTSYQKHRLLRCLNELGLISLKSSTSYGITKVHYSECGADFSQVRVKGLNRINWFSYLDILMIKEAGDEACPKTDIIREHRAAFLADLRLKTDFLLKNYLKNQKRWYHVLRGAYILLNNSYEVTLEQKREINMLHDLSEGWEEVRDKTIELIRTLV